MHVATLLAAEMFDISVDGRPGTIADALPDWSLHDRLGVVIDEPLGGVGASHLIQIASVAYYDARTERRKRVYPEIYAFHVGRGQGSHSAYDFWPARREVIVTGDHRDLLDAINDRAITRLALPKRTPRTVEHRRKEKEAAEDRLVQAFLYAPDGRMADGDLTIASNDTRAEYSTGRVLQPVYLSPPTAAAPQRPGPAGQIKERDPAYGEWLEARRGDITQEQREAAIARRAAVTRDGLVRESYRRIAVADALERLGLFPD